MPDPAVKIVASQLAGIGGRPDVAVVHLSGALRLDCLELPKEAGHPVGAFHPLQSFPRERGPSAFAGSLVAIDASTDELLHELEELARALGGIPRRVTDGERALYHAAAVFASNYLVALAAQAVTTLESAGWEREEALPALLPLMRGVLQNLEHAGLPGALIGPIRRGDVDTVRRHLDAIGGAGAPSAELREQVYRILGLAALELAVEAGLDADAASEIKVALTGGPAATRR